MSLFSGQFPLTKVLRELLALLVVSVNSPVALDILGSCTDHLQQMTNPCQIVAQFGHLDKSASNAPNLHIKLLHEIFSLADAKCLAVLLPDLGLLQAHSELPKKENCWHSHHCHRHWHVHHWCSCSIPVACNHGDFQMDIVSCVLHCSMNRLPVS